VGELGGQRAKYGRRLRQLLAQEPVLGRRLVQGADKGFDVGLKLGDHLRVGGSDAVVVVAVGQVPEIAGASSERVGERSGHSLRGRLLLQRLCLLHEFVGVAVGARDVRTGRLAAVQAWGVGDVEPVAQGAVGVVDAHQERVRVVVDGQGRVAQDVPCLTVRADGPGEVGGLGGGVDRSPGGRP
jgi:hypothetical protein